MVMGARKPGFKEFSVAEGEYRDKSRYGLFYVVRQHMKRKKGLVTGRCTGIKI